MNWPTLIVVVLVLAAVFRGKSGRGLATFGLVALACAALGLLFVLTARQEVRREAVRAAELREQSERQRLTLLASGSDSGAAAPAPSAATIDSARSYARPRTAAVRERVHAMVEEARSAASSQWDRSAASEESSSTSATQRLAIRTDDWPNVQPPQPPTRVSRRQWSPSPRSSVVDESSGRLRMNILALALVVAAYAVLRASVPRLVAEQHRTS